MNRDLALTRLAATIASGRAVIGEEPAPGSPPRLPPPEASTC